MRRVIEERRRFLERLSLAAGYAATSRGFAANETIQIGCIGTGGGCRELMRALDGLPGVRITAVADVQDSNLAEGRKLADPKAFATRDFTEVLGRKDVDAVVIGAPDHWHAASTLFSESPSRVVASVAQDRLDSALALAREFGVPALEIGRTGTSRISVLIDGGGVIDLPVTEAEGIWDTALDKAFKARAA